MLFSVDRKPLGFLILSLFVLLSAPHAGSINEEMVAKEILKSSRAYNIDPSVLFTIANIESDFSPLVLTIECRPKQAKILEKLRSRKIRVKSGGYTFHSKRAIVNLYPQDIDTAKNLALNLRKLGFIFDLGIMQINSVNFSVDEAESLFHPRNNVKKSAEILRSCMDTFKREKDKIECYNRGAGNLKKAIRRGNRYYPYWNRYKKRKIDSRL